MTLKQQEQTLIEAFGKEMQKKLDKRSNKGRLGWRKKDIINLYKLLLGEVRELLEAVSKSEGKSSKEIRDEAIDVANFAMMIWDKASKNK